MALGQLRGEAQLLTKFADLVLQLERENSVRKAYFMTSYFRVFFAGPFAFSKLINYVNQMHFTDLEHAVVVLKGDAYC